jgi:hypothetical protein
MTAVVEIECLPRNTRDQSDRRLVGVDLEIWLHVQPEKMDAEPEHPDHLAFSEGSRFAVFDPTFGTFVPSKLKWEIVPEVPGNGK